MGLLLMGSVALGNLSEPCVTVRKVRFPGCGAWAWGRGHRGVLGSPRLQSLMCLRLPGGSEVLAAGARRAAALINVTGFQVAPVGSPLSTLLAGPSSSRAAGLWASRSTWRALEGACRGAGVEGWFMQVCLGLPPTASCLGGATGRKWVWRGDTS